MNKNDLIKEVSNETGFKNEDVKKIINCFINRIIKNTLFGIDINIQNFISFKRVISLEKRIYNKYTNGKEKIAPKRWRLKVNISKSLKDKISKKPIY